MTAIVNQESPEQLIALMRALWIDGTNYPNEQVESERETLHSLLTDDSGERAEILRRIKPKKIKEFDANLSQYVTSQGRRSRPKQTPITQKS